MHEYLLFKINGRWRVIPGAAIEYLINVLVFCPTLDLRHHIINIIKLFAQIFMLAMAGQTAGPNGLKVFMETHGCLGSKKNSKSTFYKNSILKFFTGNAGHFS